jgi:hypothetical protein
LARMLATSRVDHFAAIASLSGGLASFGNWEITYERPRRQFPALVLWGGPTDQLGIDFHTASMLLRDTLVANDHFVIACKHNSGHALPPIMPPSPDQTRFISMWQFMLDHDFDTEEGRSPYLQMDQLPSLYPDWCTVASAR